MHIASEPVPVFSEIRLVTFSLNSSDKAIKFGINAHKVREVIEFDDFEPLPPLYSPYFAVINLRGVPVPLMDLNTVLYEGEKYESKEERRVIICEILGKLTGIVASKHIKMIEVKNNKVLPVTFNTGKLNAEHVSGIVDQKDHYLYMIDLENVLESFSDNSTSSSKELMPKYPGKKILIVEDSRVFRRKLEITFKAMGFSVYLAEDGQEGLQRLSENDDFDLVFSDIEMPKLNGIEMSRKIKENSQWKHIPIIFHSSISNKELINQIHEEGLGQYIVKFNEAVIKETIAKLFENSMAS